MKAGVRVRGVSDYVPTYSGFYGRFETVFIFIVKSKCFLNYISKHCKLIKKNNFDVQLLTELLCSTMNVRIFISVDTFFVLDFFIIHVSLTCV